LGLLLVHYEVLIAIRHALAMIPERVIVAIRTPLITVSDVVRVGFFAGEQTEGHCAQPRAEA
jgi:hypothetical protein